MRSPSGTGPTGSLGTTRATDQGAYRGLRRPERAYALASVLDLFELRWIEQDGPIPDEVRRCCRVLLADRDTVLEER